MDSQLDADSVFVNPIGRRLSASIRQRAKGNKRPGRTKLLQKLTLRGKPNAPPGTLGHTDEIATVRVEKRTTLCLRTGFLRVFSRGARSDKIVEECSLRIAIEQQVSREFPSDIFEPAEPLTPEEELEQRRSALRNGLTDMQRLFLFGKLSGLNDKEAALAAGYSVSVAENTKQRIWKPRVRAEFERLQRGPQNGNHNNKAMETNG